MEYPDGNPSGSCAYCVEGRGGCSILKDSYPLNKKLQAWLDRNAGLRTNIPARQNNLDIPPAGSAAPNDDLDVESATSMAQSSKSTAINNNVPEAPSIDTLPVPSVQTVKLQATIPPDPLLNLCRPVRTTGGRQLNCFQLQEISKQFRSGTRHLRNDTCQSCST